MYESRHEHLIPLKHFYKRLTYNVFVGFIIVIISQFLGMLGYHHFEKMTWVDAYVNAAMILSGMGPLAPLETTGGKIFAGTYALFSGVVFLVAIAIIMAPVAHRFLHKFHLQDNRR